MKANNPMQSEKTKNKMIESLKRINHKPILQGGNGRGLTYAQKSLLEELGEGWYPEFVVKTKQVRNLFEKKPPNHYKIDIANPILKIAIEIDGHSHCTPSRKEQDFRKTKSLEFMGWTTLRFTNKQIKENPKQCLDIVLKSTESPTEETR